MPPRALPLRRDDQPAFVLHTFAYRETMHLPFYVSHPDVSGGQDCVSLTGHIDIVPTLLTLAGASRDQSAEIAGRELPGKDFSSALSDPKAAKNEMLVTPARR